MSKKTSMKTSWDLSVLYKSKKDPNIRKDMEAIKNAFRAFEKKYRNRTDYLRNEQALLCALKDSEKLTTRAQQARPLMYFLYLRELNSEDVEAHAMLTKLSNELTEYGNRVLFFHLRLGHIDAATQQKFLSSKRLTPYRYDLEKLFEDSKHDLSEAEEKILNLKSLASHDLWIDGNEKLLNKQTVAFKGKDIPVSEAMVRVNTLPVQARRKLQDAVMQKFCDISDFAESELNAIVLDKKVSDELRGYPKPYSATIRGYENDEASILNLVDTTTEYFRLSKRFYRLKAKMLGLKKLAYADRSARVGKLKSRFTFSHSSDVLRDVLEHVDPEYAEIFERFLAHGQIDVYPKIGKSGGAFCSSSVNNPTFVLLNHTDSLNSFTTLAHEMGHAIHSEMSKTQPVRYQGYTTSVAETASTLFEALAFDYLFNQLPEKEQIVALHDKINDDVSSIFRQIAFFNFELELHQRIREQGFLGKESIAALLNTHMKRYLGPVFDLKETDGYFFVAVSHFRRFFYVYSYAYGQLISKVMASRFKADTAYRAQIKAFLCAGRSKSPEQIFKDIGIDTTKPGFFEEGLYSIERDINTLERLLKK